MIIRSFTTFGKLNLLFSGLFILFGIGMFIYTREMDNNDASISFILLGITFFFLAQTLKKEYE